MFAGSIAQVVNNSLEIIYNSVCSTICIYLLFVRKLFVDTFFETYYVLQILDTLIRTL